jgi:CubicO group peptidase (beta-lactamase class C family)
LTIKFKCLIAVVTLSGFSISATASTDKNTNAPEASATESTLAYSEITYLEKAFISAKPADRNDGILVGELGIDGGNKDMIVKLAQEIADYQHGSYDSLLIAHKGKLLFESYYLRGRVNLPHYQASATKSYTGLALGRAIQMGYLTMADLDKPIVSFLKDLDPTKFVEGAEKITLKHALTMRSGIRISDEQRKELNKRTTLLKGQGQVQALLELSAPITVESQTFKYGGGPELVMQVIDAVVPGSAQDFIKNELLDKMGIATYSWRTNGVTGLPESGWRTNMTSRDMLKFGLLARNKGQWKGEQLIPKAFITQATSKIVDTSDQELHYGGKNVLNQCYGYFWWCADLKVGNKSYFSSSAQGGNGQFITLIEEHDLLIVHTASDNDASYLQTTAERILPAFIRNTLPTISENIDSQSRASVPEGPYLGQKTPGLTPEVFAPGIVSKEHRDWTGFFTPDMKEYYFGRYNNKSNQGTKVGFKFENNQWRERALPPELGGAISPDGKTMHDGNEYRERTDDGWSELKSLGPLFENFPIMRLTASKNGTYVFDVREEIGTIRYSRLVNGKREIPIPFSKNINSGKWTAHPFIAADESYVIWDSEREGGFGGVDLYISFRQQDGSYGPAINFGDKINTAGPDSGGVVSPDGKYFFFNRKISDEDSDVYWVDAQIIETLRPKSQPKN